MELQIQKTSCLVCLKNLGSIPFFSNEGNGNASEMISWVFKINIICDVNFPDTVCSLCMGNIISAVKLKKTILNSEKLLTTYFEINKSIKTEPPENLQTNKDTPKVANLNVEQLKIERNDDSFQVLAPESTEPAGKKEVLPSFRFPEMYDCEKCEVKTETYKKLMYHLRFHPDVKMYECEKCGKTFKVPSEYRKHKVIHSEYRPFKCRECGKGFKDSPHLAQHRLIHKTEAVIPCPKCGKLFCHTKGLNSHLLTHNERTEVCEICSKTFKHSTFLKIHIAQRHADGNRRYTNRKIRFDHVTCEFCGKQVSSNNLKKHIDYTHFDKTRKKQIVCSFCDKRFSTATSLEIHMQSHFNSKKVPMDIKTKEQLLKYKCDECEKGFTSQVLLRKHKIIHSGVKEHICSFCGKEFAFKMYLERHVRLLHDTSNPRNFNCHICGKVSACGSAKKLHMLTHTGETPYHCQLCEAKFVYAKSLRVHISNKHNIKSEANKGKS